MTLAAAEADRRIANVLQVGTIVSVDPAGPSVAVNLGDITIPAAAVGMMRAGGLSLWWMPAIGEQVLIACPGGDMARAIVVCGIFAGNAPSDDAAVPLFELAGGEIHFNGTLIVSGDVIAGGISLQNHIHGGVTGGAATTEGPQ
ncbi:phage baseplate assembly protein V [Loktanella sp. TSTF-M6]|uniref:Phage baseplate assembly protein V n=1 Tax=Loktanella gaetbuli TaxID=2881335 RepID=A0ABS8BS76_9RHOB|nr:phage baseplate assembly protein V [Loktanella gaetbuli]MCB5198594.1 phage baseplate assembly protein V [Loktanella gaetbuli]